MIEKALKRLNDQVQLISLELQLGNPVAHGWEIFPDETGCGPIFISLLQKKAKQC